MSRRTLLLALGAGVALSASVAFVGRPAVPADTAAPDASPPGEVARIQAHLAAVERELLARDVSHLSPAQRAARAEHIAELRAYRERGVFPHNHDFDGERVPYFVDEHGTRCAMAHLIEQSGHGDLVARVAATANNARIPELAGDSALVAWLDANGLTLAEAARVQPSYDGTRCETVICVGPDREPAHVTARYGTASALSGGTALAALVWTLGADSRIEGSRARGLAGLAAGAAAMWLGASQFDERGTPLALGVTNAALGAATTALTVRSFLWRAPPRVSEPESVEPGAGERRTAISVSPHLEPRDGAMGVRIGLTF